MKNLDEIEKKREKKPLGLQNVLDWDYATVEKINRNAQYMNSSANKIDREVVHGAKMRQ